MDVFEELREEGREEGERKRCALGERKRCVEGRARTVLDLLRARFGAVPATAKTQIPAASESILACWSLRVLTAPTLEAVLAARHHRHLSGAAETEKRRQTCTRRDTAGAGAGQRSDREASEGRPRAPVDLQGRA